MIAALIPVYLAAVVSPGAGVIHDDGVYMVTAQSLATGNGYQIRSLPSEIPQTKYPILYPLVLAALWKLYPDFPANIVLFKLFSLLCTAVWVGAAYRLCRRMGASRTECGWVCLWMLSSGWVLFAGAGVMSDMLFCALTAGALVVLDDDRLNYPRSILGGLLCGAAFLSRTIGATLIVAAVATFLLRRRFREGAVFLLCALALAAPWLAWQASQSAAADANLVYYSKLSYQGNTILSLPGLAQRANVLLTNLVFVSLGFDMLLRFPMHLAGRLASMLLWGVALYGAIRDARRLGSISAYWFLLYSGLLLIWVYMPDRYLVPLLPLAAVWAIRGMQGIPWPRVRKLVVGSSAAALALCSIVGAAANSRNIERGQTASPGDFALDRMDDVRQLCRWVRNNTPPESVLAANNDPFMYLLSGHKAVRIWRSDPYLLFYAGGNAAPLGNVANFKARLLAEDVRYLMVTPMEGFGEAPHFHRLLSEATAQCSGAFRIAARANDPNYYLIAIDHTGLSACSSAQ